MLKYSENASKLHKAFGDFLEQNQYTNYKIIQEIQVQKICPTHKNSQDRFDYYLPELHLVVELHGEQHYKPSTFGGMSKQEATRNYVNQVKKDSDKRISAIRHKLIYINFSNKDKITLEEMQKKIQEAVDELEEYDYDSDEEYLQYLEEEKEARILKNQLSIKRKELNKQYGSYKNRNSRDSR